MQLHTYRMALLEKQRFGHRRRLATLLFAVAGLLSVSLGSSRNAFVWAQTQKESIDLPVVAVYDNVLPKDKSKWLHQLCSEWNDASKNHGENDVDPNPKDILFEFPLEHPQKHPPIQQFLNHLIWEMVEEEEKDNGGTIPKYYVEYWTRQEWHHILAHQDMDEGWERILRKERQECYESLPENPPSQKNQNCEKAARNFKHPIKGQVLYLQVGSSVLGPTVVFDVANGGDLMVAKPKNHVMVSVPAVEGRLLRFEGDRLHAVPRPHDVYWTFDQSRNNIHTTDYERSVLLFNLWEHTSDKFLVDKVLDCGDGKFPADRRTCYSGDNNESLVEKPAPTDSEGGGSCNPQNQWNTVSVVHRQSTPPKEDSHDDEPSVLSQLWEWFFGTFITEESFQVPLSGDAHKRGISGYVARLVSPSWWEAERLLHPARDNLKESFVPTWTEISADQRFVEERREL